MRQRFGSWDVVKDGANEAIEHAGNGYDITKREILAFHGGADGAISHVIGKSWCTAADGMDFVEAVRSLVGNA